MKPLLIKNSLALISFPTGSYACNCSILYSIKTKEALIIDPGNDHKNIITIINNLNLNVKKLIHTHAHFDHIGMSTEVANTTGATMHLHRDDLFLYEKLKEQGLFFRQIVGDPKPIDSYLNDGEEFSFDDPEINVFLKTIHTPGHTPGSCSFYSDYFETPILFAGDTLFNRSIGRTDLPGGDGNKIIKSIKDRLLTLPEETNVITGHGNYTRIFDEKKFNPFLC